MKLLLGVVWSERAHGDVTERRDRASPVLAPFLPVQSHIKWLSCGFSPPPRHFKAS